MVNREGGGVDVAVGSDWPERLRRGVRGALRHYGISKSEWVAHGLDVHHIVAAGLEAASPSRTLLTRWSIGINTAVNAAIIPRSFHQGQGLHRQEFLHIVNQRLAAANMFAEALVRHGGVTAGRLIIIQTIQKIGSELVLRSGDSVAIRLQSTLHDVLTRPAEEGGGGGGRSDDGRQATARIVRGRESVLGEGGRRGDKPISRPQRPCFLVSSACS